MATYYKRKNGNYCVRVSNGMKNGKQELIAATYRPVAGHTASQEERDVRQFADLFEAAVHNGVYMPGMQLKTTQENAFGLTVGEFINRYYFDRIEKKLSPNTIRLYRAVAEQFIIPSFGSLRLSDITVKHQQSFVSYLSAPGSRADTADATPLSPSTVKRYSTVFSSIMTEACKMGFIEENKIRYGSVDYPRIVKKKIEVYNDDEVRHLFDGLKQESPMVQLMLLCALLLGMRRGEIVALKWSDIDIGRQSVSISRSAYKMKDQPQMLKLPKSQTSIRTVYFPDVLIPIIEDRRKEQAAERMEAGTAWKEQDFVFTNSCGDMISLYAPTRICNEFEKKNGLHHLKFHGLRHTCGSLMCENGVDAETVKTVLGHDSLETTNLYVHPYEKNMRKAADLLGALVTEPSK